MPEMSIEKLVQYHEKAFQPDLAGDVEAVVQYHLTGEGGGDWIIDISHGVCKVSPGLHSAPDVAVSANADDFRDILLGEMDAMAAFMRGKVKVNGNMGLAMRLTSMFKMI